MKKFLCILLCAVMLMSLLAGCGGNEDETQSTEHKHTYASEYSYDAENHWKQATCEHSTLQANAGEHIDDDLDGVCDICAYAYTGCEHTFADAWSTDETSHWHAATCVHIGNVADKADHADENNDGACDVCGYMGDHEHSFSEEWTNNETQHWHDASCGHDVTDGLEDHVDMTNDGVCDVCGLDFSGCEHTFAEEWKSDVTYHWHAATCEHMGATSGMEQHADSDENGHCDVCDYLMCNHIDYDLDGECDICGYVDPDHTHEYGEEMGADVNGHWYVATCHPGATSAVEEHKDQDNNGVCDVCSFQICGHSYESVWTSDETHHWHAIRCTCSIARKDYAEHVDTDGDGGCDVCMYGLPVPAVYETIVDNESITLKVEKMITYTPFTVYFPQAGKYVITPNRGEDDIRVWMTDGSDYGADDAFFNSGGALTLEVEEAGEMTLWFRMFSWTYGADVTREMTYSVVRMDDLVITTMQGKVELPANTVYTAKFVATEVGTYKLITGVDGLVIGLTENTMEYFKGHIELNITEIGEEFTFYLFYEDESVNSFVFDWRLEPPFCLEVGEGNYAVDVEPTQIDYKIQFTAPEAGYYLMSVTSEWLTFCAWSYEYNQPVRLETTEILTPYLEAGETYTIWLQTVYDYPAATNCFDTLTVSNVGKWLAGGTTTPGAEGSRYHFQVSEAAYYRIEVTGGELGIIAPNGTVTWTADPYEVKLEAGETYVYMLRGSGEITVKVTKVIYEMNLINGSNTVTMEPNRHYDVVFQYKAEDGSIVDMDGNSVIALSWEGNLYVYVNGVEYKQGTSLTVFESDVTILVKSNGAAEVKITVTVIQDGNNRPVDGVSEAELIANQTAILAVNRDGDGAKATFTAEVGGTYTLTTYDAKAMIYVVSADGAKTLVLTGQGDYSFNLDAGQTIEFFVDTTDESTASISLVVTPGN